MSRLRPPLHASREATITASRESRSTHDHQVEPQRADHPRRNDRSRRAARSVAHLAVMRTPRPALQHRCASGAAPWRGERRERPRPKLRGMATSSSYSSPLRAAARGATPGQQGTRSSSIVIAMPDAAAPARVAANPSEMSVMARAPRRASHRPAAMRGTAGEAVPYAGSETTARAQRRQREPRASKPPSHHSPLPGRAPLRRTGAGRARARRRPLDSVGTYQVSPRHSRADTPRGRADADHDLHGG